MDAKTRLSLMEAARKPAKAAHGRYMTAVTFDGKRAASADVVAWSRRIAKLAGK